MQRIQMFRTSLVPVDPPHSSSLPIRQCQRLLKVPSRCCPRLLRCFLCFSYFRLLRASFRAIVPVSYPFPVALTSPPRFHAIQLLASVGTIVFVDSWFGFSRMFADARSEQGRQRK
ncbi:hypothetical protein C8F01DRAFT_4198 [Mycena amicta]|nr:hypothetical protein C8F01DRAFT_4198 [Mycena amicta]